MKFPSMVMALAVTATLSTASATEVEVERQSPFDIKNTAARYVRALQEAGVPVLALRHGQSETVVFQNPLYGTNMGQCDKSLRKDQPLEARIWRDKHQRVWLTYSQPRPAVNEFGVIECGHESDIMGKALSGFADAALAD